MDYEQETWWDYRRFSDEGKIETITTNRNDFDGKLTGHPGIFGVKEWLDENPEERIRLGYTKCIHHNIKKTVVYNSQTQYLIKEVKILDEHTTEDVYHIMDKTEEMMRRTEEGTIGAEWAPGDDDILVLGVF